MKVLVGHQTGYIPWLGFFHKVALADAYVHFDQVQYVPKDWINRNQVRTSCGATWLTVPVLRKGYLDKKISEIEINNKVRWQNKHWKTLLFNYKKAPYFKKYADFFEEVYKRDWELLSELNLYMLDWYLDTLGIDTEILMAWDYDFKGAKSDLVLDMCKQLEADLYIFGGCGRDYADIESFTKSGVIPVFQEYNHPIYSQIKGKFMPYMGIIDLLFNEGPNSLDIIMYGNKTRKNFEAGDFY
jgi:hypothetical protein